jgi:hypothetical protein
MEVHVVIANSGGVLQVRLDTTQEIDFSGDTQPGADTNVDNIRTGIGSDGPNLFIDDLALNDAAGSVDNSWPGDGAIIRMNPDGAGTYTQLSTLVGAASHWEAVDESPPDNLTSYVADDNTGVGNIDSFTMESPSSLSDRGVSRILVSYQAAEDSAGSGAVAGFIRTGGSDFEGSSQTIGTTTFTLFQEEWQTNPDTGLAWVESDLIALEAGVVIRGSGATERRITAVKVLIESVPQIAVTKSESLIFDLTNKVMKAASPLIGILGNVAGLSSMALSHLGKVSGSSVIPVSYIKSTNVVSSSTMILSWTAIEVTVTSNTLLLNVLKSVNKYLNDRLVTAQGLTLDWGQPNFKEEGLERWVQSNLFLAGERFFQRQVSSTQLGNLIESALEINVMERYPSRRNIYNFEADKQTVEGELLFVDIPIFDFDADGDPRVGILRVFNLVEILMIDDGTASGIRQEKLIFETEYLEKFTVT